MKRIISLILSLVMIFSLSVSVFADELETLAEDNTMLNFCVDVTKEDSFYDAVLWAYLSGITNGTDNVHFSPNLAVTRGQAVTFFWNLAGKPVVDYFMQMDDVASGSYYAEAVRWALSLGITSGTSKTTFSPDKACTVAEIITLLWRFSGNPVVNYAMNYEDVPSGAYYSEAIRWALSLGIAHGTTEKTFGSNKICTRSKTISSIFRFCALMSATEKAASTGEKVYVCLDSESNTVCINPQDNTVSITNDANKSSAAIYVSHDIARGVALGEGASDEIVLVPRDDAFNPAIRGGQREINVSNNTPIGSDRILIPAVCEVVVPFSGPNNSDAIITVSTPAIKEAEFVKLIKPA